MASKIEANILQPIDPRAIERSEKPMERKNAAAMKVAKSYEALFVNQLVTAMRKTVTKGGMVPESNAERVFQSMLDSEYSQKMADTQQLGLANMIYDHLVKQHGGK